MTTDNPITLSEAAKAERMINAAEETELVASNWCKFDISTTDAIQADTLLFELSCDIGPRGKESIGCIREALRELCEAAADGWNYHMSGDSRAARIYRPGQAERLRLALGKLGVRVA